MILRHIQKIRYRLRQSTHQICSDHEHLQATVDWIIRAHDQSGYENDKVTGLSKGFDLLTQKWLNRDPLPSVSVIPILLKFADLREDQELFNRALSLGMWLINNQNDDGSTGCDSSGRLKHTALAVLGWTALYEQAGEPVFLDSALRAGKWLAEDLKKDGPAGEKVVAHCLMAARSVLHAGKLGDEPTMQVAGAAVFEEVVEKMARADLFSLMGIRKAESIDTHNLIDFMRTLLESSVLLKDEIAQKSLRIVKDLSESVLKGYELNKSGPTADPKSLAASLNSRWRPAAAYSDNGASAKMAMLWLRCFECFHNPCYLNGALKIIDQVKSNQDLLSPQLPVKGAVAATQPIYAGSQSYSLSVCSGASFVGALNMKMEIMRRLDNREYRSDFIKSL